MSAHGWPFLTGDELELLTLKWTRLRKVMMDEGMKTCRGGVSRMINWMTARVKLLVKEGDTISRAGLETRWGVGMKKRQLSVMEGQHEKWSVFMCGQLEEATVELQPGRKTRGRLAMEEKKTLNEQTAQLGEMVPILNKEDEELGVDELKALQRDQEGVANCFNHTRNRENESVTKGGLKFITGGAADMADENKRGFCGKFLTEARRTAINKRLTDDGVKMTRIGMAGASGDEKCGSFSFWKVWTKEREVADDVLADLARELRTIAENVDWQLRKKEEKLSLAFMTLVNFTSGRRVLLFAFTGSKNLTQLTFDTQVHMGALALNIAIGAGKGEDYETLDENSKRHVRVCMSGDVARGHMTASEATDSAELEECIEDFDSDREQAYNGESGRLTLTQRQCVGDAAEASQPFHSDFRFGANREKYKAYLHILNLGEKPIKATQLALCKFKGELRLRPWLVVNGGEVPERLPTASAPYLNLGMIPAGGMVMTFPHVVHRGAVG